MNSNELQKILDNHELWINEEGGERADLQEADLRWANLQRADLQRADLREADLDFSCLPLWCGSKNMKVDKNIASQIAAHFCALDCDDKDFQKARKAILKFALTNKHAGDLGLEE
jgi:uncharacterized protein YjbI with pentapeptide repeats